MRGLEIDAISTILYDSSYSVQQLGPGFLSDFFFSEDQSTHYGVAGASWKNTKNTLVLSVVFLFGVLRGVSFDWLSHVFKMSGEYLSRLCFLIH